ncbi:MAG: acetolactate synthase small subunit [Endomicrobium sp.]|nr:acetolactate synthase small subunit [Endomicrobium sp.]
MSHTISILVENKFGVLARISGIFAARGFNIKSLTAGETKDPSISIIKIVIKEDNLIIGQITKQLKKLVDVIKITDCNDDNYV